MSEFSYNLPRDVYGVYAADPVSTFGVDLVDALAEAHELDKLALRAAMKALNASVREASGKRAGTNPITREV